MLSKGSNRSKDSNREESPCQLRERPTNQVLSDQKARQLSQVTSSGAKRIVDDRWHSARKSRERAADY